MGNGTIRWCSKVVKDLNVGIVVEGPRDIDIIENILYHSYPEYKFKIKYFQPEGGGDTSERGCGWKGVKKMV